MVETAISRFRALFGVHLPVGSKEIGERGQYDIDAVHHGQRPIPKGLSKTCQYFAKNLIGAK
jgi:hypothetical protein